ncbi:unnamed protein product [Peronospora destructor]|uniref:HIG1 domain-containing protein n=1 Tax=Peronospora destructor TaxID=86335 RepID=A0AAV0VHC2_9STRA|nr:unnamed protein product [Peronospora destructor]
MTDAAVPRISGMIWTRSVGILRVWKSRYVRPVGLVVGTAVVTADGILRYKKKTDAEKTTKIDLVKAFLLVLLQKLMATTILSYTMDRRK